ncbi:MAG TPA: TonB-dependent receptor [Bacteroidia bacterium]|nr:TonB-dependent receptor [Bacteroidia bacterium]
MKIKIKSVFLALVLLMGIGVFAQNGGIKGIIKTSDGVAAEYVNIGLKGTAYGTAANFRGEFELKSIPAGAYTLVTSFIGLEKKEVNLIVKENEITTVPEITLKENAQTFQEVVVSSNGNKYNRSTPSQTLRLNAPILEIPQNIQVVTADALRDQQVVSMSDGAIRNVSGAVRLEHWGDLYTNIVSRGSQIQAFRNGFNVVNSYWGPLTEDMSFVDHIEFVKGPAGFMLSNGDPAGLYNVVTKKPTGQTKGEVNLTLSSFDLYKGALDLDGKLSKDGRLLYRLNVSAQNKKSHRANEYNNRYVIAPVISYQLDDKTKLTLEYNYQNAQMSNVGSFYVFSPDGFATLPVDFTTLPTGLPATKINDHSVYVMLDHKINDNWILTTQLSRFYYYQNGSSMWPTKVNADGTMIRNVGIWEAKSSMTMGQVFVNGDVQTGVVRHRILAGVDVANKSYAADWGQSHDLDTDSTLFNPHDPELNVNTVTNGYPQFDYSVPLEQRAQTVGGLMDQRYASGYVQDELGFLENRIRLTLAGRYTYVKQAEWGGKAKDADHFTPRVGLSISIDKTTSVYGLYDQAFIPQIGQLREGQGSVKPITGDNTEAGIKKDWFRGKWSTTLAVYKIMKNNELIADPSNKGNESFSIIIGQKKAQGVEFDLRGKIANGLDIIANYAFTESKVTRVANDSVGLDVGDIVPGYAKHTANLWLTYTVQSTIFKGFGASIGGTFLDGRETYWEQSPDRKQVLPAYYKLDGGISWEKENIKISANMFNILNEYLYSGSYYGWLNAYNWQTEAPRNVRVSVSYRF